jgi:hypothetical protein
MHHRPLDLIGFGVVPRELKLYVLKPDVPGIEGPAPIALFVIQHKGLDYEMPAWQKVLRRIAKDIEMRPPAAAVKDRVEHQGHHREAFSEVYYRMVTEYHVDLIAARFFSQLGNHLLGAVDPSNPYAASVKPEHDASGPYPELQYASLRVLLGQHRKRLHRGLGFEARFGVELVIEVSSLVTLNLDPGVAVSQAFTP